jgi:hypothetical protein
MASNTDNAWSRFLFLNLQSKNNLKRVYVYAVYTTHPFICSRPKTKKENGRSNSKRNDTMASNNHLVGEQI